MPLPGRSAIITGATSGIGEGIARAFAAAGARLFLTGRDAARGAALCNSLAPADVAFHAADLTRPGAAETLVEAASARFGPPDILVNNAGILHRGTALTCTDTEWEETFATNVTAPFRLSRAVLRVMVPARRGVILNIASDWALVAAQGAVAYGASKGALAQMTRSMAADHARDGIRVNALCPGDTDTRMLDGALPGLSREEGLARLGAAIPMGRVGRVEEVAAAAVFLASDAASFITGALIPVDGGNSAV